MDDARPAPSVVIVEDDQAVAAYLADNLAADGFRVTCARGAGEALRSIEVRAPDLVLLDLVLGDGSGLSVLDRVRAADGLASRIDPGMAVIVLSGRASEADRVRGLARGADDYVVKPFSYAELLGRIRAVLRRAAGRPARGAVRVGDVTLDPATRVGSAFASDLQTAGVKHFGWNDHQNVATALVNTQLPDFLDLLETIIEEGTKKRYYKDFTGTRTTGREAAALPDFETTLNELADRHRFGYRSEEGEIRRIGSPALSDHVVGPAVFAARRAGWEHVETAYREALSHQRGGSDENDDALTAASAALESALKATGLRGSTLGELAKGFKGSELGAPQLTGVPELLEKLLKRPAAVRNVLGDAHGKEPGEHPPVPQELVDLTIHLVGSFIVYLEAADRGPSSA